MANSNPQGEIDPWMSFSEMRRGPNGDLAIIANPRRQKPEQTGTAKNKTAAICIFCPESIRSLAAPYLQGDLVPEMERKGLYVLPNKFSVVSPQEIDDTTLKFAKGNLGFAYDREVARGTHLVMIETPHHQLNPFSDSAQTGEYYVNLIWGYVNMLRSLKTEGFQWGGVGKNRNGVDADGRTIHAGASQPHLHSQAIGTDFHPRWLEERVQSFRGHDVQTKVDSTGQIMLPGCGSCLESRINQFSPERIASDKMHVSFVALIPKQNPYHVEVRIMPIEHQSHFDTITDEGMLFVASILHKTMLALNRAYPNCGYNFEVRSGAWKGGSYNQEVFHWEFSIYPAVPALDTERHEGFMAHLLQAAVLKEPPEYLAMRLTKLTI